MRRMTMTARKSARQTVWLLLAGWMILALWAVPAAAETLPETLRGWMDSVNKPVVMCSGCGQAAVEAEAAEFYRRRDYAPLWVDDQGLTRLGHELITAIRAAESHGLTPEDYRYSCLSVWAAKPPAAGPADLAALDVIMTDSFLKLARHLSAGRVDPARLYPSWVPHRPEIDMQAVLADLAAHRDLNRTVLGLSPLDPAYWKLVGAAEQLKKIAAEGGWPSLPKARSMKLGVKSPEVRQLREILRRMGDLTDPPAGDEEMFDEPLEAAVKVFQARHGLEPDGAVEQATLAELNVSVEDRLQQIMINLERWRWLPRALGDRFVMVNVPEFRLRGFDRGKKGLEMKVIVGKPSTKTPVFSETIQAMTLNPWWYVPPSIVAEMNTEKLNASYLVSGDETYTRIAQRPGPGNALGRIKFVFPNRFNVYMHDTPTRNLFSKTFRAFSHGCIRLEKPVDLALFLNQEDAEWTRDRVEKMIGTGQTQNVPVTANARVHIVYFTSWVGDDGRLGFGPDLYGRDGILKKTLAERREAAPAKQLARLGNCDTPIADKAAESGTTRVAVR